MGQAHLKVSVLALPTKIVGLEQIVLYCNDVSRLYAFNSQQAASHDQ